MAFIPRLFRSSVIKPTIRLTPQTPSLVRGQFVPLKALSSSHRAYSAGHGPEETYPVFNERYTQFFDGVEDLFELQRGLNNCFAYDLVPAVPTIEAALKAARRVNDLPTAVRIFEGLKEKVENKTQYQAYLDELKVLKEELGVPTKEELYGQSL